MTKTVEGRIELDIDKAMSYGDMAPSMIMSKYEETDMGPDENMYDDYARSQIINWGPDESKFEHEEARGGVNRRAGRIQLQYYGHRGDQDHVYRPEIFDGFMGPEDRDPRGSNVDPDMKEFRKQHDARMRFIRFTADGSDHITGGGRSEAKVMADQQTLFKTVRNRLKVFDRQLDGRRNGMRREFKHKSNVTKQILVKSYGDYIKDYALNPQRRVNIMCKEILRDTRMWREETADADFAFARYSQICRRAKRDGPEHSRVGDQITMGRKNDIDDADSKKYKTAAVLMSNIVNCKRQVMQNTATSDMDFAAARTTAMRKSQPFARDLSLVLNSITIDSEFAHGRQTQVGRNPYPQTLEHTARQIALNHSTPAHHFLNAEILYKSTKPGADTRKAADMMIMGSEFQGRNDNTQRCKAAKMRMLSGAKLATAQDADRAESTKTFNYRHALNPNGDKRIRLMTYDQLAAESDNTQNRRPLHTNYRSPNIHDTSENIRYGDNTSAERHARGLGSKYLNRFIDRDSKNTEISAFS